MKISQELVNALKSSGFDLGPKYNKTEKKFYNRMSRNYRTDRHRFTINRFPIAAALGYKWALKKYPRFDDDLLKSIGYGISLMPNCVKRNWKMAWGKSDHPSGQPKSKTTNEEQIIQNAEDLKRYPIISFSRWNFVVDLKNNRICGADMRKLIWWDAENYRKSVNTKLSKSQLNKLYSRIDKEFQNMTAEEISYKYSKQYKSWFQPLMDSLRSSL